MNSEKNRNDAYSPQSIISFIFLIIIFALFIWVYFNVDVPEPEELREIILGYGWAGWLVFIGIASLIAITPIPITIPALVAGSLYGVVEGSVVSFLSVMIGSWIGYWIARLTGQQLTFKLLGRHGKTVKNYLGDAGFLAMCTARLMPGLPYWPVNYGAGALGISQSAFLSATFIASIPGQVSLVAIGAFAVNPTLLNGAVLVVAWITVGVATWISYKYWRDSKGNKKINK
ncbi:TVP38/TMEM64 family protein [Phocicoccus pinnipedialis]|uniref:TVP38/TMEM64 family membrane protein n=1 Tax=Phocicoccus pinnipedialis TaxID=110845 RepID=A0A6V7R4S9_9BACL|nr:VTT domain-containing protein [Jeotgalicoccus pinnipedialis]MBP1939759.1 putative membrane protein YdjX (TVP38/TMEM64 family) [Jeotgalicoccus pinnipedialis]CAD2072381.1 TVP38/TMEM64 family inner membrane protein YdjZ [Jeotgalicoccus pinnipedialis]